MYEGEGVMRSMLERPVSASRGIQPVLGQSHGGFKWESDLKLHEDECGIICGISWTWVEMGGRTLFWQVLWDWFLK